MMNVTRAQQAAQTIAEVVELASFKDVGASALCAKDLCATLGIDTSMVLALVSDELLAHPDFNL